MLAVAAIVLVAAAFAWTVRTGRQRARDRAPFEARVAASKAELRGLESRLAAGEITPEAREHEQQRIASTLLESTAPAASSRAPSSWVAGAIGLAMITAGAFHFWASRGFDRSDTVVAAAAPAAASSTTPDKEGDRTVRALSDGQLQRMVDEAGQQVKKAPGDAAAWAMLAHSYDMLGKFAESSKAYATLAGLLPNDAQVLADYADALAVANGRTLAGEPTELVKKALAIDANNLKALALSGTAAYERAEYPQAVAFWQRALAASPDPAFRQQIEGSIVAAKSAAHGDAAGGEVATVGRAASPAGDGSVAAVVSGRVTLADDLVAKAPPDAIVYIFARPAEGSRMPVALMRTHVRDLPADFSLDDSSAMVPEVRLSQVRTVVIGARISRRGDVTPQPGDMQGWSAPVPLGTRGIHLEISEVLK